MKILQEDSILAGSFDWKVDFKRESYEIPEN